MVLPSWWLCRRPQGAAVLRARKVIDDYLEECIDERRRLCYTKNQPNSSSSSSDKTKTTTDLLNILLEAEDNGVMGHDEIKGQLLQFVFAGFDTLAPTLTYMLWEVSELTFLNSECRLSCF
jgi:cytochrome P450